MKTPKHFSAGDIVVVPMSEQYRFKIPKCCAGHTLRIIQSLFHSNRWWSVGECTSGCDRSECIYQVPMEGDECFQIWEALASLERAHRRSGSPCEYFCMELYGVHVPHCPLYARRDAAP